MTAITFQQLTKDYPGRNTPVLDGFSLDVLSGELVALLGPSGIGKSTLLKLVTGIEVPDRGDIHFDQQSILRVPPNQRQAVFMFQKPYLFPFLSVEENIAFGLKVSGMEREKRSKEVSRILDLIGLPGFEKRRPGDLSGGEQQRVALARSLVIQPKVLLLDEPFSSLDTQVRMELQEAVRSIQRELGITTILVTHDLDEAMAMSDRMALMMNGRVAAFDTPNVLFQRPPCVKTAKFMGVSTFIRGEVSNGRLDSKLGPLKIVDCKRKGESVYAIRPEHIRLQREQGQNTVPGVVKNCIYRGRYIECHVGLKDMTVRAHVPSSEEMAEEGRRIHLALPQEYLFAVNE